MEKNKGDSNKFYRRGYYAMYSKRRHIGDSRHLKNNITMIPIVTKTSLD